MDQQQRNQALVERFLSYVAISSQSDPKTKALPSSESQWAMARVLEAGLKQFGLKEVEVDEHAIVTGYLPGNVEGVPSVGFVAHMDTVDVGLSPDVHPQVINYQGGDVCLNAEKDIWIRVADHPELERYIGQDIIFTDGTSVLGADNKAGARGSAVVAVHAAVSAAERSIRENVHALCEIIKRAIHQRRLRHSFQPVNNSAVLFDCRELHRNTALLGN